MHLEGAKKSTIKGKKKKGWMDSRSRKRNAEMNYYHITVSRFFFLWTFTKVVQTLL